MNILTTKNSYKAFDKTIIIGGSARSGTTIMGKIVNSLETVEYFFEPPMLTSLLLKSDELSDSSLKELLKFYFIDGFLIENLSGRGVNLNKADDSCILHAKTKHEIENRYSKSYKRIELEDALKLSNFCFKLPEIVFFLGVVNRIIPGNRTILMHRGPNDVINSLVKKNWFSDEFLNIDHPSQIYPTKHKNSIKIPYWVNKQDEGFWVESGEINRAAYYYKRISEEIIKLSNSAIIVDYDVFVQNPAMVVNMVTSALELKQTNKTIELIDNVKYQNKERDDVIRCVSTALLKEINELNQHIKKGLLNG